VTVYVMDGLVPGIGLNTNLPLVHGTIVGRSFRPRQGLLPGE
jgi:hypothetical protein